MTSTTSTRRRALVAVAGLAAPLLTGVVLASGPASAQHAPSTQREPAQRYITALVNKTEVRKGRKISIHGMVFADGVPQCAAGVTLNVERSTVGAVYKVVGTVTTKSTGAYAVRVVVPKKARFRIAAPATDACVAAQSPPRSVTVKR